MTTIELIDQLETEFPSSRPIMIEGKVPAHIWKIDFARLIKLIEMPRKTQEEQIAASIELVVASIGNESGPGSLDNERGRLWLASRPNAVLEIARAVQDFNEVFGPNEDRKKKSETQSNSGACSTSASDSESCTLDD